jgi:hypothetical protein
MPGLPDEAAREAYSHEVSSAGFWPGGGGTNFPAFYSYAYPAPNGFADAQPDPDGAYFGQSLGEFLLVQRRRDSRAALRLMRKLLNKVLELPMGEPLRPRPLNSKNVRGSKERAT